MRIEAIGVRSSRRRAKRPIRRRSVGKEVLRGAAIVQGSHQLVRIVGRLLAGAQPGQSALADSAEEPGKETCVCQYRARNLRASRQHAIEHRNEILRIRSLLGKHSSDDDLVLPIYRKVAVVRLHIRAMRVLSAIGKGVSLKGGCSTDGNRDSPRRP